MVYHTNWFPLIDISWSLPHLKKQFMSLIRVQLLFLSTESSSCETMLQLHNVFFCFLTCQNKQLICLICSHMIHWWNIILVYFALLSIGLMSEISIAYSFKDVCHILQITKISYIFIVSSISGCQGNTRRWRTQICRSDRGWSFVWVHSTVNQASS